MSTRAQESILVVDGNPMFRETLAQRLRAMDYDVILAETGERALLILRDWSRPIGWLYTRAELPGLVDGWILADEYHRSHAGRSVVVAASAVRQCPCHTVLKQPTPTLVADAIGQGIEAERLQGALCHAGRDKASRAA
jgi:CheY-like chemotaxis protein